MEGGRQEKVADLEVLLASTSDGLWAEHKMPQIESVKHEDGSHRVEVEPLLGVVQLPGKWEFNEVVVKDSASKLLAINTTSDHGWITRTRDGTLCVKESHRISRGDDVMVRNGDGAMTWETVVSTRSWLSDTKYMLFTKSGMALVNDLLLTVLCEEGGDFANDCQAPVVDLTSRLETARRKEADELMSLVENGIQFKVADSVAAALKSSAQYSELLRQA